MSLMIHLLVKPLDIFGRLIPGAPDERMHTALPIKKMVLMKNPLNNNTGIKDINNP